MEQQLLENLKDSQEYHRAINRGRIRFGGVGPLDNPRSLDQPKLWPRDIVDPEGEIRKILPAELKSLIDDDFKCCCIEDIIKRAFTGLKECNIKSLINRFCKLKSGHFDLVPFKVHYALESYTSHRQIMNLVHNAIRTINRYKSGREKDLVLKLFGGRRNYEIYKKHIAIFLASGSGLREVKAGHLVSFGNTTMDLTRVEWLTDVDSEPSSRIFLQVLIAVTRFITELLRRYFYITISNPYKEMLFYYRYDFWKRIYSKAVGELVAQGILEETTLNDLNQPYAISNWMRISKLKFFLKKDGLRPICTTFKPVRGDNIYQKVRMIKAVLEYVLAKTPNYRKFSLNKLLTGLNQIRESALNDNKQIYFVKVDIKDCFQSIKQDRLRQTVLEILNENVENNCIEVTKLDCLSKAKRTHTGHLRQGRTFEIFTLDPGPIRRENKYELVREFNNPIRMSIQDFDRQYLTPNVVKPILRESRTSKVVYQLVQGIRQGSPFSSLLCAIYISAALNKYLAEYLRSDDCHVFRHVDDILFVSTDLEMSRRFMRKMIRGFQEFNLKVNIDKSVCNFEWSESNRDICRIGDEQYVVFHKQRISMQNLHCRYCYSDEGLGLQYSFKVSPYTLQDDVREQMYRIKIDLIHMDQRLNQLPQQELVDSVLVDNIFEKCLLFAHRAATIILMSLQLSKLTLPGTPPRSNEDPKFLKNLMLLTAKRIRHTIRYGIKLGLVYNELTYEQIRLLASSAFLCTWRRTKVRHRNIERQALQAIRQRYKARYITQNGSEGVRWAERIMNLESSFVSSSFVKHVLLPEKIY